MQAALGEARKAGDIGEVPVGAVLVSGSGEVLAAAHNEVILRNDPTAHAEILVMRRSAERIGNYRLLNTTLYVTVEPCVMCMGAAVHARIWKVVFGAPDLKWGAAGSLYNLAADSRLNHSVEILGGVCEEECKALMLAFFKKLRAG
ncbi:MAG: nucleoside deaminase [Desulfobacteraceae bacterium]|nr:MAG: nucleoside deaminase [Desulfobacteraceae bacterium]